jgi:hypothetical protein
MPVALDHAAALPSPADLGPDFHLLSLALRREAGPQQRVALAGLIAAGPRILGELHAESLITVAADKPRAD